MAGASPSTPLSGVRPLAEWAARCFEGGGGNSIPTVLDAIARYMGVAKLTVAGFKNIKRNAPGTPALRSVGADNALEEWIELLTEVATEYPIVPLSTPTVRKFEQSTSTNLNN